jgi:hypothetical protein
MKNKNLNNNGLRLEVDYLIRAAIFDRNIDLGLHRLTIYECLIELPLPDRAHHSGHQRETPADWFKVPNSAIFVNKRAYRYSVPLTRLNLGVGLFRRNFGEQFADR